MRSGKRPKPGAAFTSPAVTAASSSASSGSLKVPLASSSTRVEDISQQGFGPNATSTHSHHGGGAGAGGAGAGAGGSAAAVHPSPSSSSSSASVTPARSPPHRKGKLSANIKPLFAMSSATSAPSGWGQSKKGLNKGTRMGVNSANAASATDREGSVAPSLSGEYKSVDVVSPLSVLNCQSGALLPWSEFSANTALSRTKPESSLLTQSRTRSRTYINRLVHFGCGSANMCVHSRLFLPLYVSVVVGLRSSAYSSIMSLLSSQGSPRSSARCCRVRRVLSATFATRQI